MSIRELIPFSGRLLKNRKIMTMGICMLPFAAELFLRAAEAMVYVLLLYYGGLSPDELLSGRSAVQMSAALVLLLLRTAVTAPLMYAAAVRLSQICGEQRISPIKSVLSSRRNFKRSFAAAVISRILGTLALVPAVLCGITAYRMLVDSDTPEKLFFTVHVFVLTAVMLGMWAAVKISFSALPFYMAAYPERSVIMLTFRTIKAMHGRRTTFLKLAGVFLPEALTVAGLPFAITRFLTAWALCISIHIKEDEYNERIKAESAVGDSYDAAMLPYGKAGSVPKTAH